MKTHGLAALAVTAAALLAGCGGDDEPRRAATAATEAPARDLSAIKDYLVEHTEALEASTARLAEQGRVYAALVGDDPAAALADRPEEVRAAVLDLQKTWKTANPQYEEAEGVVAGVPELSEFDVILDAGSDGSDPESAVPFDVRLTDGTVLRKPGNFFFLTESTLFGTNPEFQADGRADLDGDGRVRFPEALPDPRHVEAFTRDFASQAAKLDDAARGWIPAREDAFQALVTMTPTMSEYFEQWKQSRFVAGDEASEQGFAASSRLADIESILSGLVLVYDNVRGDVRDVDPAQAAQTERELGGLRDFAADLRSREQAGTHFSAEEADTLGAEAQGRAEAIAGQISQAAGQLGITLES